MSGPLAVKSLFLPPHQGTNADFELYLGDYGNIFEVVPTQGSGTVSASVYVKNAASIDYDDGQKLYTVLVSQLKVSHIITQ